MGHIPERFHEHMAHYHSERSKVGRLVDRYVYHNFFGVGSALSMLNFFNKGMNWKNKKKGLRLILKQHAQRVEYGRTHGSQMLGLQGVLLNTYMPFGNKTIGALEEIDGRLNRVEAHKTNPDLKLSKFDLDDAFARSNPNLRRLSRNEFERLNDLEKQRISVLKGMDMFQYSLMRAAKAHPGSKEQRVHLSDAREIEQGFAKDIEELSAKMISENVLYQRFHEEVLAIRKA